MASAEKRMFLNRSRLSRTRREGDFTFDLVNNTILAVAFLVVLYPLIYIVSASFSSPTAVSSGQVWLLPVDFTLNGYEAVLKEDRVLLGYWNSLVYMVVGTSINVVLTILAAYPLSRKDLRTAGFFMFLFTFTFLFQGGIIPRYILVSRLGMINTRWAMWIPNAVAAYNVVVTRTFFKTTISEELLNSAQIDGASDFSFLFLIVLPLSKAIIAVNVLFYGVAHWNTFFDALIYLQSPRLYPLQLVLRNILILNQFDSNMLMNVVDLEAAVAREQLAELLKFSLIIVASVPMLMIYPFVQRYFVKGVMIGSLKG